MRKSTRRAFSSIKPALSLVGRGVLVFVLGGAGAWLAGRARLPAAGVVGSMLAIGLFRFAGGQAGPWDEHFGRVGRVLLGVAIGSAFGIDVIEPLRIAAGPVIGVIIILVGLGLTLGWILHRTTGVELPTALMASVPGGLPAMIAMAGDTEADSTVVASVHVTRLTIILLLIPAVVPAVTEPAVASTTADALSMSPASWRTIIALVLGAISGLIAQRLGIPSGDLMGPMLAIGGANLLGAGFAAVGEWQRWLGMILIGVSAGAQISRRSLNQAKGILLPAIAGILVMTGVGFSLGWGVSRVAFLDLPTALLSCTPGGASTLVAIAYDLGGDARIVAALHFLRQITILLMIPVVLRRALSATLSTVATSEAPKACGPH